LSQRGSCAPAALERRLKRQAFIGACKQAAWLPIQFLTSAWSDLFNAPLAYRRRRLLRAKLKDRLQELDHPSMGFDKHKRETTTLLAVSPVSHLQPNHQSAGTISITSSCSSVSGTFSRGLAGICRAARAGCLGDGCAAPHEKNRVG
jgi:hypothetical protein